MGECKKTEEVDEVGKAEYIQLAAGIYGISGRRNAFTEPKGKRSFYGRG